MFEKLEGITKFRTKKENGIRESFESMMGKLLE